ncbi:right-handed parallel beta-helix repeat-containing protein [Candidatus Bathyarchaeota archaeon]|nr:right-handed parallel beta-helix repeat-containing protein [Candidatus Bathyarchaeota archaeon]
MKKQIYVFVTLLSIIFSVFSSASRIFPTVKATYVEDPITKDTIWTLVDSPFVVSKDITVYPNATLTIEPSVEVRFGEFSLKVLGVLFANGTSKSITFTSNKMLPQDGDWNGILFNGMQKSTLINCFVKYATNGILVENGNVDIINSSISLSQNGITALNAILNIQNTTVSLCSQNGIIADNSEVTIQNSIIMENKGNGISITGDGPVTVQWNIIMANGNGILLTGNQTSRIYINRNKISANKENGIQIDAESHSQTTISYNNISSNTNGIYISTPISTYITNNSISYNAIGVLYDRGSHTANYNDIYANEMGMNVELNATVNAEYNYWGDKSGPYHDQLNPTGQGNPVGGDGVNLDFIFFLFKSIGYINTRPTAVLLSDKSLIPPNGEVMFFATGSFDADGRVDRYLFNFGDGYSSGWTTLSIFTHKYSTTGTYSANLTVVDDYGTTSDVVSATINVQNLTPLQASAYLSDSTVHEKDNVSVTVHVTDSVNPVENATITMFSVIGGNFSQSSGLTNATGYLATTFTAPDIAEKTYIRIVARVSKSGYADGSAHQYLEVSPFLSVQIDANPNVVRSEGTSQVLVHVKSNDEPVVNASVTLSSSLGSLSSETGVTDSNGAFSVIFTAPQTTTLLYAIMIATATKSGYMDGTGQTTIVIEPKILNVQIVADPNATISEAKMNITVSVKYETIPIAQANVTVTAESGNFSTASGLTDAYGNITFTFTAPPVSTQSKIIITAIATKTGYATAQNQLEVTINPRTFIVTIDAPYVKSEELANVIVQVMCKEDATPVVGANVTIWSSAGNFNVTTKTTDASGACNFVFRAPYTTAQIFVTITANVTKNGYINGGNQTETIVIPKITSEQEGGWPLTIILLILIPIIIIAIAVVILVKLKIISVSTREEEEEYQ